MVDYKYDELNELDQIAFQDLAKAIFFVRRVKGNKLIPPEDAKFMVEPFEEKFL